MLLLHSLRELHLGIPPARTNRVELVFDRLDGTKLCSTVFAARGRHDEPIVLLPCIHSTSEHQYGLTHLNRLSKLRPRPPSSSVAIQLKLTVHIERPALEATAMGLRACTCPDV